MPKLFSVLSAVFVFSALPVVSIFLSDAHAARPEFQNNEPLNKKIGDLRPTFYWVALEENDGAPRNRPLKDMAGNVLAMVSQKFYSAIRLEGTGRLLDGRVLNFEGRVPLPGGGQEIRYIVCPPEAPFGYGVDHIPLVPFRSVAVDPRVVPMGSKVFIPKAIGARLPDGTIHDGYFMAVDIGDAIKNKRIDIFTEFGDQSEVFRSIGLENMKPVEVFLVN